MSIESNESRQWYALYTKPRHEFVAEAQLKAIGIEVYLPSVITVRQWSDRKKKVKMPLMNSYIFILGNEKDRLEAIEQTSVSRCVFDRGRPAVIPDFQIENLKKFVHDNFTYMVVNGVVKGAKIKITEGPFAGTEGVIIEEPEKNKSIAVSIELLNRTVIAEIPDSSMFQVVSKEFKK